MKHEGSRRDEPCWSGGCFLDFKRISRSMQYAIRLEFRICGIFDSLSDIHFFLPSFMFGMSSGWCQQAPATRCEAVIYWTAMVKVTQWLSNVM
jgi:hypothetical protein